MTEQSPTDVSVLSIVTRAPSGTPPASEGAPWVWGSAGSSITGTRSTLPWLVTMPMCPRAVDLTAATMTSCADRSPSTGIARSSFDRANRPVLDISTTHGSSVTSNGTAVLTGAPSDSSSTVRRGVPCSLATSASSPETTARSLLSSSRMADSSLMVAVSSSRSDSSSIRLNFVKRRSGISRMYAACVSLSSKT